MYDTVSIVSGGFSASQVDLTTVPGFVIGVNNSALHQPRIDAAITMDRRWSEAHWPFFVEKAGAIKVWMRPNNVIRIKKVPGWTKPEWLTVYQCDHKSHLMSDIPGQLNGTNSGGVALNLAYSFKPKKLYLFGFDYCPGPRQEMHWFAQGETGRVGDYPIHTGRYAGWARQFSDVAPQFRQKGIDVVNVSASSIVTAFRKITPKEYAKGVR